MILLKCLQLIWKLVTRMQDNGLSNGLQGDMRHSQLFHLPSGSRSDNADWRIWVETILPKTQQYITIICTSIWITEVL